jgi:hypothetical protein
MLTSQITNAINHALNNANVEGIIEDKRRQLRRDVFAVHAQYVPVNHPDQKYLIKIYFDFWDEDYRLYNEDVEVFIAVDRNDEMAVVHWQHADK